MLIKIRYTLDNLVSFFAKRYEANIATNGSWHIKNRPAPPATTKKSNSRYIFATITNDILRRSSGFAGEALPTKATADGISTTSTSTISRRCRRVTPEKATLKIAGTLSKNSIKASFTTGNR